FTNILFKMGNFLLELLIETSEDEIPQRVSWKITKSSSCPVRILKNTLTMVLRSEPQVFLIFLIPDFRNFTGLKPLVKNHLFDFITNDYMEIIVKLTGFNSDNPWNRFIKVVIKTVRRNPVHAFWKKFFHLRVQMVRKFP